MSKLNGIKKEALWLTYGKKCAYTGNPIEFSDVTVDHIIPKSRFNNDLKREYSLPDNFKVDGIENLLPVSEYHNKQKGNVLFDKGAILYFLNIARKNIDKYNEIYNNLLKNYKRRDNFEILRSFLKSEPTGSEIAELRKLLQSISSDTVNLSGELRFADSIITDVSKSDIDTLLNSPVLPRGEELELINEQGDRITVKTCMEYTNANAEGYYASNNWGIKFSGLFERQFTILNGLKNAKPPKISYMENIGLFSLDKLPAAFYPVIGEEDYSSYSSYADAVNKGVFKIQSLGKHEIAINCGSDCGDDTYFHREGHTLIEMFRSDITGDGVEDMMIMGHYSSGGSLSFSYATVITYNPETCMFVRCY
ncbi:MAG: hypothetical protein LBP51_06885 [Deferribacteraceae bacterium]|nr:hypothetical protein [Deferribacteraceae bacterium]